MNNEKGFSLIELLFTIVTLGIVVGVGVLGYDGITTKIKEKEKENIIKRIEVAASKYAYDTGNLVVYVEDLVNNGYLDDTIYDPITKNNLDCSLVSITKNGDSYKATYDENEYRNEYGCEVDKLSINNSNKIKLSITYDNDKVESNGFVKSSMFKIKAEGIDFDIDCNQDKNECIWTNNLGLTSSGDTLLKSDLEESYISKYTFKYIKYNDNEYEKYTTSIDVAIDNNSPYFEVSISDKNKVTLSKEVIINASDGNGSGIYGYFIGNASSDCKNVTYEENNVFNISDNGSYKVCVKDKVDNYSEDIIVVNKAAKNVIFDTDGGILTTTNKLVLNGDKYGSLPVPVKEGYEFLGWYTKDNEKIDSDTIVNIYDEITLYAKWDLNEYNITFDSLGGIIEDSNKSIKYNDSFGFLPVPVKEGYEFLGWYTNTGEKITENSIMNLKEDITLYANYKKIINCSDGDTKVEDKTLGTICTRKAEFKFKYYDCNCDTCQTCKKETCSTQTYCSWYECSSWGYNGFGCGYFRMFGCCTSYSCGHYETYTSCSCDEYESYTCNCESCLTSGYFCPDGYETYSGSGKKMICYKKI